MTRYTFDVILGDKLFPSLIVDATSLIDAEEYLRSFLIKQEELTFSIVLVNELSLTDNLG